LRPRAESEASPLIVGRKPFGRFADFVSAAALLVVLSPLLLLIALLIKLTSRGPVFFTQERAGLDERPFRVFKFRTMYEDNDDAAHRELCRVELVNPDEIAPTTDGIYKLENDPRITRVGAILRRLSFDELPQLLNVLRGEMAIVGPRPLPVWEVEWIPQQFRTRARVRPGLTGLWQVRGRNRLNTLQMLELDVEYVSRRSWRCDLDILARTPAVLVRGDGAR
jgi:lipopolysaccharide/colanic/teichoic acid biosynthesis glycosyltransferase